MKYLHFIYARNEHFLTHLAPETHKYKQNKTGNTDKAYEYLNRKKHELPSESQTDLMFRKFSTEVWNIRLVWAMLLY